jgi:anti-anti-sigma regulatory factor
MVTFSERDQQLVCTFTGQLTTMIMTEDGPSVEAKVGQVPDRSVVFELAGVSFVASSFLRLCVQTARKAGASWFSVRNLNPELKKVFVIAGLDKQLTIT